MELDEIRDQAKKHNLMMQHKIKYLFDKRAAERKFNIGDMVQQWNARMEDQGKHGKFEPLWMGPFVIAKKNGEGSYFL